MSNSPYIGVDAAQQARIRPMFEVHPIPNEQAFVRTVIEYETRKDEDQGGKVFRRRVAKQVKEFGGYMVYFPRGHSIRIRDRETLRRLGFDRQPGFVDMESGEVMPMQQVSLKSLSERRTSLPSTIRESDDQLEAVLADADEDE